MLQSDKIGKHIKKKLHISMSLIMCPGHLFRIYGMVKEILIKIIRIEVAYPYINKLISF